MESTKAILSESLSRKYTALQSYMKDLDSVIVAFSGGIDSSLVAFVAKEVLKDRMLAVTSGSDSLKREDLKLTQDLAQAWNLPHKIIKTTELDNLNYQANPTNRCYYCKSTLYDALRRIADEQGFAELANGTNLDDLGDFRPGLTAAKEQSVRAPLAECHFNKQDIRALADFLGLANAKKPQAACLSSRVPYGTEVSSETLAQIERAETILSRMGIAQCRVRHHESVARIEVPLKDFDFVLKNSKDIESRIKACGYQYVTLDLGGFRSGSLNEGLKSERRLK